MNVGQFLGLILFFSALSMLVIYTYTLHIAYGFINTIIYGAYIFLISSVEKNH